MPVYKSNIKVTSAAHVSELSSNMVFAIVQIKCGLKVVKPWYGCAIVDSCSLSDLHYEFSGGQLDGSLPIQDDYIGATVDSFVEELRQTSSV